MLRLNTFTVHTPNLTVQSLLSIKSKSTINVQNVIHLNQCMHGHVLTRTVAHFQEFWGGYEWCDRQQKWVGEGSLHF